MSNDTNDIEWTCECGHTNPDFAAFCQGCGQYRYYGEDPFALEAPDTEQEKAEDREGWN